MLPIKITKLYDSQTDNHRAFIFKDKIEIANTNLDDADVQYLDSSFKDNENKTIHLVKNGLHYFFIYLPKADSGFKGNEMFRLAGAMINPAEYNIESLLISDLGSHQGSLYFAEGLILSVYKFDKFITKSNSAVCEYIFIDNTTISEEEISIMNILLESVYINRDVTNEPQLTMNTAAYVDFIRNSAAKTGFDVEVFNKKKIQSLKMGGLLVVNQGSFTDPAFAILKWKPENAVNSEPLVFVGKGVMFDTGGLNIKTGNFMYEMHMDMAGSASAFTALMAIAKAKLPVFVIAILPITDNRPGNHAFAPGDILTISNGKTVEIINTDAEGRLILADALTYAQKLNPELVIDLATLTGSAARAIGKYATVGFQNDQCNFFDLLLKSGEEVYERIVEFPLWDEYNETLKSDFADVKNLGGAEAGATTAAKFLENFVDYPWVHLDIAGTGIMSSKYGYQTAGASGVGTRLLFEFCKNYIKNKS